MKKILLTLVGLVGLTMGSWGQSAPTVSVSGLGAFNNEYSLTYTMFIDGSDHPAHGWYNNGVWESYYPVGSTIDYYGAGPLMPPRNQNQLSLTKVTRPNGTSYIPQIIDQGNPFGKIDFNQDGTVNLNQSAGYATTLDATSFSATWSGGGFGPGYSSSGGGTGGSTGGSSTGGSGSAATEELTRKSTQSTEGLILQNGEFHTLP